MSASGFRAHDYHDTAIDFHDIRYGAGTGIRYISPIGPLRFDVGFNPRPRIIGLTKQGDPLRAEVRHYLAQLPPPLGPPPVRPPLVLPDTVQWLARTAGDRFEVEIEGIGRLSNPVVRR